MENPRDGEFQGWRIPGWRIPGMENLEWRIPRMENPRDGEPGMEIQIGYLKFPVPCEGGEALAQVIPGI